MPATKKNLETKSKHQQLNMREEDYGERVKEDINMYSLHIFLYLNQLILDQSKFLHILFMAMASAD